MVLKDRLLALAAFLDCSLSDIEYDSEYADEFEVDGATYHVLDQDEVMEELADTVRTFQDDASYVEQYIEPFVDEIIDQDDYRQMCFNFYEDLPFGLDEDDFKSYCVDLGLADWEDFDEGGKYEDPDSSEYEDLCYNWTINKVDEVSDTYNGNFFQWYCESTGDDLHSLIQEGIVDIDPDDIAELIADNLQDPYYDIYNSSYMYMDEFDCYVFGG